MISDGSANTDRLTVIANGLAGHRRDVRVIGAQLFYLPVETRVPLKFGNEVLTQVICARVRIDVEGRDGRRASGWGETPLSVQWVWPSNIGYDDRLAALQNMCESLVVVWPSFDAWGHALEIGHRFQQDALPLLLQRLNSTRTDASAMPHLAALVCCSSFDIALHDAYGNLHETPIYETYNGDFMSCDLSAFLVPADDTNFNFEGKYPVDFLTLPGSQRLPAWHLVGGLDAIDVEDLTGQEPDDGHPVLLRQWIRRDGLTCLKIKLGGQDAEWDYERIIRVGKVSIEEGVKWLSTDFNCTVTDTQYVNDILDRLKLEHPRVNDMILYVEQPFPYDLEAHQIDVHSVSARKPLFMDESAHDWRFVRLGRSLGWTGVALKTCKTQTGAILSLCWARAHGMELMVQDLTNPMLAMIPHAQLAAHADTIMGVETNACQFYPEASRIEQAVHPGLYQRRHGMIDLSTIGGSGFGYRLDAMSPRQMQAQDSSFRGTD